VAMKVRGRVGVAELGWTGGGEGGVGGRVEK